MIYSEYFSVTPIDGRYRNKTKELTNYFSEFAYMRYRLMVEVEYFIALSKVIPQLINFPEEICNEMRLFYKKFVIGDFMAIKKFEKSINHDVKAVEYFLRDKFDIMKLDPTYKEFIHFGLTSQDINNTAMPSMLKNAIDEVYIPNLKEVRETLFRLSLEWERYPMLARTHGQPASPTRLGKEIRVFVERLDAQIFILKSCQHTGKFGGATGNFNAHSIAYPDIDWKIFSDRFVAGLGLYRQKYTTQIEHYDGMSRFFHLFSRVNTILLDACKDFWQYISMDYLVNIPVEREVGSSAMPHKVNPIDFENAEGNFGMANAVFMYLSQKLPISRLQRDLTDSTVSRNIGTPFAHTILGFKSFVSGLKKLKPNSVQMDIDLEKNWVVVSEAIQTILRREGVQNSYQLLKDFTRGNLITKKILEDFVKILRIPQRVKEEIKKITPYNYTGI